MPKYVKKKDLKNAIDKCPWYHIGNGGELVKGANSSEDEPLYKYSDIQKIIKNLPTRKFETESQIDYGITGTIGYRCPKCGRSNFLRNQSTCVYCGVPLIKAEPRTDCAWKGEDL